MGKEFRENLKLSDYLNKILIENEQIAQRNQPIQRALDRSLKRTKETKPYVDEEYDDEHVTSMEREELTTGERVSAEESVRRSFSIPAGQPLLKELRHVPSIAELEEKFGGRFEEIKILAKIGREGKKVHKVRVNALKTDAGYIIYNAVSDCGSQRWSSHDGSRSPIFPIGSDDLEFVNCDKCRGIRVKGGKDAGKPVTQYRCGNCGYTDRMGSFRGYRTLSCPKCGRLSISKVPGTGPQTRPQIDPDSRPKEWKFSFKLTYRDDPQMPWNKGRIESREEHAKGMTEEEAIAKITRQEMRSGYYESITDFDLLAVWTWNGYLIWKKSGGSPRPVFKYTVTGSGSRAGTKSSPTLGSTK